VGDGFVKLYIVNNMVTGIWAEQLLDEGFATGHLESIKPDQMEPLKTN
jgi:hypothetical protein